MKTLEPIISIPVDLTNPGQFFACCGLLELAARRWPGTMGHFDPLHFHLSCAAGCDLSALLESIKNCDFLSALPEEEVSRLDDLEQRQRAVRKHGKVKEKLSDSAKKQLKQLISKRRVSGFILGNPFDLRLDWWIDNGSDNDHLKTWSGPQIVFDIAQTIRHTLSISYKDQLFQQEEVLRRQSDNDFVKPLSFDSGRVGTAQDIGYSPEKVKQALTCSVWTEFMCLVGLQRFAIKPSNQGLFVFHAWGLPLGPLEASIFAKGFCASTSGCEATFRFVSRDSKNNYHVFQQATLSQWRNP
jgi:CRISPR-associated protein Csb3